MSVYGPRGRLSRRFARTRQTLGRLAGCTTVLARYRAATNPFFRMCVRQARRKLGQFLPGGTDLVPSPGLASC